MATFRRHIYQRHFLGFCLKPPPTSQISFALSGVLKTKPVIFDWFLNASEGTKQTKSESEESLENALILQSSLQKAAVSSTQPNPIRLHHGESKEAEGLQAEHCHHRWASFCNTENYAKNNFDKITAKLNIKTYPQWVHLETKL